MLQGCHNIPIGIRVCISISQDKSKTIRLSTYESPQDKTHLLAVCSVERLVYHCEQSSNGWLLAYQALDSLELMYDPSKRRRVEHHTRGLSRPRPFLRKPTFQVHLPTPRTRWSTFFQKLTFRLPFPARNACLICTAVSIVGDSATAWRTMHGCMHACSWNLK